MPLFSTSVAQIGIPSTVTTIILSTVTLLASTIAVTAMNFTTAISISTVHAPRLDPHPRWIREYFTCLHLNFNPASLYDDSPTVKHNSTCFYLTCLNSYRGGDELHCASFYFDRHSDIYANNSRQPVCNHFVPRLQSHNFESYPPGYYPALAPWIPQQYIPTRVQPHAISQHSAVRQHNLSFEFWSLISPPNNPGPTCSYSVCFGSACQVVGTMRTSDPNYLQSQLYSRNYVSTSNVQPMNVTISMGVCNSHLQLDDISFAPLSLFSTQLTGSTAFSSAPVARSPISTSITTSSSSQANSTSTLTPVTTRSLGVVTSTTAPTNSLCTAPSLINGGFEAYPTDAVDAYAPWTFNPPGTLRVTP
ncbi:hypothetical protein BDZ45DRAFT_735723 [Acephala macrosclerotiorum]|nr:hypothetical protein BDZ45DRAFT_735723 [Acephala macrosclerotiorum]